MKKNKPRPSYVGGVLDKRPYTERTEIFPIERESDNSYAELKKHSRWIRRELELGIGYDE